MALQLFQNLKKVYQERLAYHAATPLQEQYDNFEAIVLDIQAYERNVMMIIEYVDLTFLEDEMDTLQSFVLKFPQFSKASASTKNL